MSLRKMEENLGSGRSSVMSVLVGIICFVSHRHIFNYLKRRHSVVQLGVLNKILRSRGYLNSIVYNIRFLEMCLENSVAPKGLQRRVRKAKVYHSAVIERAFVRDELAKSRLRLQQAKLRFYQLYQQARSFLNLYDFIRFSWLLSECDRKQRLSLEVKYSDSIKRLRFERYGTSACNYDTIINLAKVELSVLEKEVLCRGVDFGVPPVISEPEILAEFELLQRQACTFVPVSKEAAEKSRCELAAVARDFAMTKPDVRNFSLGREHRKTLRDLRMQKDLVITRPDKGRATVIITKADYVEKMMKILNDGSKFKRLGPCEQHDRTLKEELSLQAFLNRLLKLKEITAEQCDAIRPVGSIRPRMYGLPKVHKDSVPLRPILSMSGSPQFRISRWLCDMLKPVLEFYCTRCVRDSFTFSEKVKIAKLSRAGHMCSFDVVSLFTNVPLQEVIDICAKAIYHDDNIPTLPTSLTEKSFKELMYRVTSGVEFSFDGVMYRQVDGVAMGSPLGPILANIFVGFHEKRIPSDKWPEMYERYVDDIFSHFVDRNACDQFALLLNSLHPALRFTCEHECNGCLPFMDVKVSRRDFESGFVTSIFRKRTFTGLYTRWDSFCATRYKINLVRALVYRVLRICSPSMVEPELNKLRDIFTANGYPGNVLDKYITATPQTMDRFIGPSRCPVTIRLPWMGNKAGLFEKKIRDAVRGAYFATKLYFVYSTARAFGRVKDRLPTPSMSNVVYKFECQHCGSWYVGRTSQHLSARIKQHVPRHLLPVQNYRRRGRPPKTSHDAADYQSAIARHLAENEACRREYSDDQFRVLARGRSEFHLKVLEAVVIRTQQPPLCTQKSFVVDLTLFPNIR